MPRGNASTHVRGRAAAKPVAKKATKANAKVATKRGRSPQPATPTAAIPPAEPLRVPDNVFHSSSDAPAQTPGMVTLFINGNSKGTQTVRGRKLGEFVQAMSSQYGIKSFTVYVDGRNVAQDAAGAALDDATHPIGKIELIAKDSRALEGLA